MDMESKVSLDLLKELREDMDKASVSNAKKPVMVAAGVEASTEPKTSDVETEEKESTLKKMMGVDQNAEKKTYIDPNRQKLLEEVEKQEVSAVTDEDMNRFPGFKRSKKVS